MGLTRILTPYFCLVRYSYLNVVNMTPPTLLSDGTADLDGIIARWDSGHFALN